MQDTLGIAWEIRQEWKRDRTYVSTRISVPPAIFNAKGLDWEKYVEACRQSLDRLAAQESIGILGWAIDLEREHSSTIITHHVYTRGLLPGTLPIRIARALQPARGYLALELLVRALENGWPLGPSLKYHVETNRLRRYDSDGKRLTDPIPGNLLALAVWDPAWRRLISPTDKPWAFINTMTQRMYERDYSDGSRSKALCKKLGSKPSQELIAKQVDDQLSSDPLVCGNILDIIRAAGCTPDSIDLLIAKARDVKGPALAEYLTEETGTPWDKRRVEAARGSLRRRLPKLRAAVSAGSQWKPPNGGIVYRQRLGVRPWNGLWTYSHRYEGAELEIFLEVMFLERIKLFRQP